MWWRKTATARPAELPARSALAMALEPRMLFDGAVAATVAETATAVPSADAAHAPASGQDAHSGSENLAATPAGTTDNRQEVVFVDSSVKDYQQLVSALKPGTEVVVLDGSQDGLRQIADYLDGRRDIDAIHVFSHGDAGKVQLGNVWIDDAYVAANNALLADIGSALNSSGDILLYGCHVGADGSGVNFIQSLAAATGADIAASTDPTGAADKGGDWVLEATRGSVETVSLNIGSYSGLLAAFSDNFTTNPGTTSNSFDRTLGGVSYTYTFTADGDGGAAGGGLAFDNFGSGGSAAMTLLSSAFNTSTTERVTITRTDLADFTFTSIYIDNPGGNESVTVGGYLNGVLVGSAQIFTTGTTTLNFGGIRVDEVRLTSTDFFGLAIDDFTGDTNPPNSAPIINNLNGNSATFVEGGSPVLLDENADATVTDSDSANFDTGNVTVSIISNGVAAEDVLSIRNQGTGAGQIGVSGSAITFGGTQIGTYAGGTAGNSLVITLDSDATPAAVQALVRNLTYSNSNNDNPSSAARTVRITVSDGDGGTSNNADVTVNVTPVNDLPTVANAIPNQNASEDAAFNFQFAANTFNDVDVSGALTYTAQLAGGGALPAWLSFDAATRTFSGTPGNADVGTLSIDVIANDGNGGSVTDTFDIVVANTNDAPTVANAIPNQNATEEAAFSFQFAANTFNDVDAGDTLSYSAQLAGGGALPAWLSFDPVTRTFSGTPGNGDVGTLSIDVIASDSNGGSVTDTFNILVANTNDAPTLANAIANQNASEDTAFNFQFAANTFNDMDAGDTLSYSVQLVGGGALPAWLSFDALTRTFSGTPGNADAGTLSIEVIASDGNGGSVSDTFDIVVSAVNDAPTVTAPASIIVSEDMPTALTGISFSDVDAGTSPVTVTLSVPSGSLSATSAAGVTVGGTSSAMSLTGSISDINTFISAAGVVFTTASNATSDVTLTIEIDDGGNTGSGGAQTDSTTVTLDVSAVNDAPVNSLPGAQDVDQDASLVFSSGNGNLISIGDVDAGSNTVEVTLSASNGLLTLSGTTGLSFSTGDGTADSSMTFSGSISDINNALNGLTFSPTAGYNGAASLQITTDDQGWSGSGGAQSDSDMLVITVNSLNPRITDVSASTPDGSYKAGDTITITTTFNQAVTVDATGGTPTLLLETGLTDRIATYVSGSGSNTLTFSYTVQAGDLSADLDYQSTAALALNGATIQNATADNAVLTLPTQGTAGSLSANKALVVDGVRPTASILVDDTALAVGETATVTITFSEAVTGLTTADFIVANGSLSNLFTSDNITYTATLTPSANVTDSSNLITLDNTGVIDLAGNTGSGTTDSNNYAIDSQRPTATIVVSDTALSIGETATVTIVFSEAVTGLTTADFIVANGSLSNLFTSDNITYTATLTPDAAVEDPSNLITLDNTGVQDAAGNAGTGSSDSNNYQIDTLRPDALNIVVSDSALAAGETATVTITFSEAVTGLAANDFTVASAVLSNLTSADGGITWTATLTPNASVEDASNLITLNKTGLVDAAGNAGSGTSDSNNYAIDNLAPVNSLPVGQITDTVTPLVFSSGNDNAITVSDGSNLTVVISVGSGTLTATSGGTAGIINNGTGTVTITGTAAEVNAALQGLTYTPNGAGVQTLSIQTTDTVGNVDSDNLAITVNNATLLVTSNLDTGDDASAGGSFAADQADGGGLSLREALHWARAGDTITFDLDAGTAGNQGGSITLNGTQLQINYSNIKLDGDLNDDGAADVTISANNASRVMGISNSLSGVEITGLTLTQGSTAGGGGALQIGSSSSVTVRDSNFTNSTDAGLGGGGIYGASATLTMINSTVSGNTSSTFGGGIRIVGSGGTLNLINSTVSGNTTTGASAHGGGIQYGATGSLTIINSTISGNAATGATSLGGGLRITSGTAFIYNSTIVGNASTDAGGGVHANGNDTFVNTVVAGNTSGAGATAGASGSPLATGGTADDVGGTIETATNSYFGSNVAIATNNSSLNNQGTSNLLLGNLANYNGSAIQTHRPQTGSALLEAGSNADLPADTFDLDGDGNTTEALPVDANGDQRVSATVDIGAVEGNAIPVLTGVNGGGTFVENGSAIVIDSDASMSDDDLDLLNGGNGDYHGASLVIVRNGGALASDSFGFNAGNGISLSGNNLVKNGQIIASFNTATAGQLTIAFTNANGETPTRADVNAVLRQLTYRSASEAPTSSVDLDIRFNDGAGANATQTASLNITAINDAPSLVATGGTPTYTENGSAVDLFSGVIIDTIEAGQSITGLTLTVANLVNGASEILIIDGTAISLSNGNSGITSGGNSITYSVSLSGGTATLTLIQAGGLSAANAQALIDGMSYRNGSEAPSSGNRVVTLTSITDSGGTANGGVDTSASNIAASVSVVAVNDAPTITASGSIAISEDVPSALTGISFSDVDAGTSPVTVTLSVPSGSLSATSGSGVSVGGTASAMTLTGSIANINAFIAAAGVSFTTAGNATADVTLTVTIDDGGNSGSGAGQTDSATLTLAVTASNDAPVNNLPAPQSLAQGGSLVFNAGNGNLISIGDVDAGSGNLQVTLTASNGLLTLGSLAGLSFTAGDGTADATLTFTGTLTAINNALNGLLFTPTAAFSGPASIQISTSDLGNSGAGGAQTDTDTLAITVTPINPVITDIAVLNPNGSYKLGDVINLTVTFDQAVIVDTAGGVPTLLLETGLIDRTAVFVSGSGSNTLTFRYTVQAGDLSADLNYQSSAALTLNGGSIRNAGNSDAILSLPATGSVDSIAGQHDIVVDGVVPTVASVSVPVGVQYNAGDTLTFVVSVSETVIVNGTPRLAIDMGGSTVFADYVAGSGSATLVFQYSVRPGDNDADGIAVSGLLSNGATLRDASGNTLNLALNNVGDSSGVIVDTTAPSAIIAVDPAPTNAGSLRYTVIFNEAVSGVDLGDFSLVTSGNASGTLGSLVQIDSRTFQITVTNVAGSGTLALALNANGSAITDAAGNLLVTGLVGQAYSLAQSEGDPEFRVNPPSNVVDIPSASPQPVLPSLPPALSTSPLLPPPLFEVPTLGSGIPTLGNIFINQNVLAPSYIAQVFASSSDAGGDGSGRGFLGFGGGDGGVFGSSSLSSIFGSDALQESEPLEVFDGKKWGGGSAGAIFGAPTLGQQLHDLREGEQRQLRELAHALQEVAAAQPPA